MNTPAHLLFGAAAFGKAHRTSVTLAAVAGGLAPDLSLYLMAGVSLFILQIEPQRVFDVLYYSEPWQMVFAIDNSALLWSVALAFAVWKKWPILIAFTAAALLHIALDFPLHHNDGRAHFWPITRWVFESPISYWDTRHHAGWIAPIELILSTIAAAWLHLRHRGVPWLQALFILLIVFQAMTTRGWYSFVDG